MRPLSDFIDKFEKIFQSVSSQHDVFEVVIVPVVAALTSLSLRHHPDMISMTLTIQSRSKINVTCIESSSQKWDMSPQNVRKSKPLVVGQFSRTHFCQLNFCFRFLYLNAAPRVSFSHTNSILLFTTTI